MQTVALSWQQAGELSAVLAVAGIAGSRLRSRRLRATSAFVGEAAVVAALYSLWQLAGKLSTTDLPGAFTRARWIDRFDQALPWPSERTLQHLVLGHSLLVEAANLYYATMHLTTMLVFLVWLFVRHRDVYPRARTVLAFTTLGCLLVQLLPVAPPRMLPGFVDTGLAYGQSVYSNGLPIDQLSAMPSLHVAWAALVGYYGWRAVSPSRWRWLPPVHTALTVFVVVVTGNHWWLDGIVAVAILVAAAWAVHGAYVLRDRWTGRSVEQAPWPLAPGVAGVVPVDRR